MSPSRYLPSRQFSLIATSLLVSLVLVFIADKVTNPNQHGTLAVDTQVAAVVPSHISDWQASLTSVQKDSGISLPPAPDQNTVDALLQAAQSDNITQTISRSLFVNLANAKGQGMGDDIPTQTSIVNQALSQIPSTSGTQIYAANDLTVTSNSADSLHIYGNAVMDVLIHDSDQEYAKTLVIIDAITTQNNDSQVALFDPIQQKYKRIVSELIKIPVPKNLEPFHLQLVNDYANIVATYDGLKLLSSDPLKGLSSAQQYNSLTQDAGRMFINIAQTLDKNDILFNKDEPGATWAILLQSGQ